MLRSPGIKDRRPKARYFSTLLRIIKMTKASELPDSPKTAIWDICKFITCVGASPLATKAALVPVADPNSTIAEHSALAISSDAFKPTSFNSHYPQLFLGLTLVYFELLMSNLFSE